MEKKMENDIDTWEYMGSIRDIHIHIYICLRNIYIYIYRKQNGKLL